MCFFIVLSLHSSIFYFIFLNKKEVEALYNVTVVDVNTMKYAGKNKSRYTRAGIINGRTNAFKKMDRGL